MKMVLDARDYEQWRCLLVGCPALKFGHKKNEQI